MLFSRICEQFHKKKGESIMKTLLDKITSATKAKPDFDDEAANAFTVELIALKKELKTKDDEIGIREEKVQFDLNKEFGAKKQELEASITALKQDLETQKEEYEEKIETLEEEKHTQQKEDQKEIRKLQSQIAELGNEYEKLNNEYTAYRESHEPTIKKLRAELDDAKKDVDDKNKTIDKFRDMSVFEFLADKTMGRK